MVEPRGRGRVRRRSPPESARAGVRTYGERLLEDQRFSETPGRCSIAQSIDAIYFGFATEGAFFGAGDLAGAFSPFANRA